jgi:hypothetical protein
MPQGRSAALRLAGYWVAKNDQGEYLYSSLRFREETAAELRRMHDHNQMLEHAYESACKIISEQDKKLKELEALNAELLEALKSAAEYLHDKSGCLWLSSDFQRGCRCSEDCSSIAVWKQARAAIAKAEGEQK